MTSFTRKNPGPFSKRVDDILSIIVAGASLYVYYNPRNLSNYCVQGIKASLLAHFLNRVIAEAAGPCHDTLEKERLSTLKITINSIPNEYKLLAQSSFNDVLTTLSSLSKSCSSLKHKEVGRDFRVCYTFMTIDAFVTNAYLHPNSPPGSYGCLFLWKFFYNFADRYYSDYHYCDDKGNPCEKKYQIFDTIKYSMLAACFDTGNLIARQKVCELILPKIPLVGIIPIIPGLATRFAIDHVSNRLKNYIPFAEEILMQQKDIDTDENNIAIFDNEI